MPYLLGVDEAGYGPNLGPLVMGASAWHVPEGVGPDKLYHLLKRVVAKPNGAKSSDKPDDRLAIGDSKELYKSGDSLGRLERGVHAALALLDHFPRCWRDIWPWLDRRAAESLDGLPWHAGYDEPLPLEGSGDARPPCLATLTDGLAAAGVRVAGLRARVLFPAAYNDLVERHDNKAEVLSLTTLTLVRDMLDDLPAQPAIVVCDKHGGRNHYAAILQHIFPEELIQVRLETRDLGVYELRHAGRKVEFRFLMNGERMLPTALASMTAKYLRELAMRPFNAYWQRYVPGLKATAGYYNDAKRFVDEIRGAQKRLKIDNRLLWRTR